MRRSLLALTAVLITACGGSTGVRVDTVPTSVIFHAGKPGASPVPQVVTGLGGPVSFGGFGGVAPYVVIPPAAVPVVCPVASPTTFPAQSAGFDVDTKNAPPVAGAYRWSQSGTASAGNTTETLTGFQQRLISNVVTGVDSAPGVGGQPDPTVSFDTADRLRSELRTEHWLVKTNAVGPSQQQPVGAVPPQTVPGDPEGGVTLKSVSIDNGTLGTFAPPTGLLMLPLPVTPGQAFTATASDPSTQETVSLAGTVESNPVRVDACGTVIAAWQVDSTITVTTPSVPTGAACMDSYAIAPQYGGILVKDAVLGPTLCHWLASNRFDTSGSDNATYVIGQLTPTVVKATP